MEKPIFKYNYRGEKYKRAWVILLIVGIIISVVLPFVSIVAVVCIVPICVAALWRMYIDGRWFVLSDEKVESYSMFDKKRFEIRWSDVKTVAIYRWYKLENDHMLFISTDEWYFDRLKRVVDMPTYRDEYEKLIVINVYSRKNFDMLQYAIPFPILDPYNCIKDLT